MKNLFVLITGVIVTTTGAIAAPWGTPDQDPIVKDLRQRFEKGALPKADELLKNTYVCKEAIAGRNDFRKLDFETDLTFAQFDGYLILHAHQLRIDGFLLANNGREWVASRPLSKYIPDQIATLAYRGDTNGNLISEWSYTNPDPIAELDPLSDSVEGAKVVSYAICVPKP